MTIDGRLERTVRIALGLAADADLSAISYGETEGWDSVGHMELVAAIEVAFGIELRPDDVFEMSDYAAVSEIVARRRAARPGAGSEGAMSSPGEEMPVARAADGGMTE